MTPAEFWDATPREVMLIVEANRDREQARERDARASAWLTAVLGRCDPKKFPKFEKFVGERPRAAAQVQTPQEQRAAIHLLARSFGKLEKFDEPPDYSPWERLRARGLAWEMKQKKGNA